MIENELEKASTTIGLPVAPSMAEEIQELKLPVHADVSLEVVRQRTG